MLVVACIKQVPDTTQVQIDPVTNTLVREGIPFIVNPYDTHAIEESLQLKDKFGVRVAAISMGPPNAEATLRKALAQGADEAILLSDRVFGGADTLATSNVLSEAIRLLGEKEEVGLVICGKQTIDGDTAQVGPGIATRLGLCQLTLVDRIVPMRLASADAEVQVWNNEVLKLDVNSIGLKGSPTWVSRIFSPEREKGEIIGDGVNDPVGTANLLIDKLLSKDLLAL